MVSGLNLCEAGLVVELGPGTGAFTQAIAEGLGPATEFLALELDEGAVRHLRRRFPKLRVVHDSAENLGHHVRTLGRRQADYVVSGLPWAIFPEDLQARIMQEVTRALAPGGRFVTFAYLHARRTSAARRFWRLLHEQFAGVELSKPVWANLPPAVVYRAWKPAG
jgi:phospholipid N-methyltransferase